MGAQCVDLFLRPFNRTTMELKHARQVAFGGENTSFNRTTMELKHNDINMHFHHQHSFNRTTMELKLISSLPILTSGYAF